MIAAETGMRWRLAAWAVLALLALGVVGMSLRFLSLDPAVLAAQLRNNLLDHPVPFFTHTIVAPFAMLIGIWQFLPVTRRSRYHRLAGRAYVACVAVAGGTGLFIAPTTDAGLVAGIGFTILALLWLGTTLVAWSRARAGDYRAHRDWMIRSYAMTSAAITLRLIIPAGIVLGFTFQETYVFAAWASWIVNLAAAEAIVRRLPFRGVIRRPVRTRTAAASP